jgi:hypothetical protein
MIGIALQGLLFSKLLIGWRSLNGAEKPSNTSNKLFEEKLKTKMREQNKMEDLC